MLFEKGHKLAKGGARPNSGRKPDMVKALAMAALVGDDVGQYIESIKEIAGDPEAGHKIRLAALIYLTDRILGKPKQGVAVEDATTPTSIVMEVIGPRWPDGWKPMGE